ncbi:hypothetical protein [Candidatus Enterococcus leclercqii]|uniref:hypothetical protein n=1 Tax=Candidatus Enterococcus leclercqii TaxID=1857218 RepID=UPI001379E6F1|nr:hypothetical protein [Enterococcus sp. CU9D]KAF1293546.1 hypothetical protein BAU14_02210 [Enterococcus sp. CU9D]
MQIIEALLRQYPLGFFYICSVIVILFLRLRIEFLERPFKKEVYRRYRKKQFHELLVASQEDILKYSKYSILSVLGIVSTFLLAGTAYYFLYLEDLKNAFPILLGMLCSIYLQFPRVMYILKKIKMDHYLIVPRRNKLFKVMLEIKKKNELTFYYQIYLTLGMVAQILPFIISFQFLNI